MTKLAWPPPPAGDRDEGGRRDTPTEMYVKGVHAMPSEESGAEPEGGDRDTPTRAYSMEAPRRSPYLETLKSPVGEPFHAGAPVEGYPSAPRSAPMSPMEATDPANFDFGDPPTAQKLGAPPDVKMTIPLGSVFRGMHPAPGSQPAPQTSAPTTQKPGWQTSLDRALVTVGRQSEALVRRYRALPQNTQIIVVIVAGTGAILMLLLVLFLITH